MAKLFSWLKFGKKKDAMTPEPGAGSPMPQATMTPPVEEARASMRDAGDKAAMKGTSTPKTSMPKSTPAKKTTATKPAKSAGSAAKKTSPKKK